MEILWIALVSACVVFGSWDFGRKCDPRIVGVYATHDECSVKVGSTGKCVQQAELRVFLNDEKGVGGVDGSTGIITSRGGYEDRSIGSNPGIITCKVGECGKGEAIWSINGRPILLEGRHCLGNVCADVTYWEGRYKEFESEYVCEKRPDGVYSPNPCVRRSTIDE